MDRTRLTPYFAYASQALSGDQDGLKGDSLSVCLALSMRRAAFFSRSKHHNPKCASEKTSFFEFGDHPSTEEKADIFSIGIRRTVPAGAVCRNNSTSPDSSEK